MIPRVLLISDMCDGGAAIACGRLRDGLAQRPDVDVLWATAGCDKRNGNVPLLRRPTLAALVLDRLAARLNLSETLRCACGRFAAESTVLAFVRRSAPHIVNLHNIHQVMGFRLIELLPRNIHIVWTLHDMWVLTGYCCYSGDCTGYGDGCKRVCRERGRWGIALRSPEREYERRQKFFAKNRGRITFVSPSLWLQECVRKRFGGTITAERIPYGVEASVFMPIGDVISVRRALSLPVDGRIILVGAYDLDESRKGMGGLGQALAGLRATTRERITVVSFGHGTDSGGGDWWRHVGWVSDEKLLNLYYNAADVYVLASSADNYPNTLIEAMAAGTPAVAFDVGGCSELVRNGKTGFVAKAGDWNALIAAIAKVLMMPAVERELMAKRCVRSIAKDHSLDVQAASYVELFRNGHL